MCTKANDVAVSRETAGIRIVPIAASHAEGFRSCLDVVAREKRYLAQIEAPPLPQVLEFVGQNVASGVAQFVALDDERVVGWCDILPEWAHALRHRGTLGMGVLPDYRGKGIGRALLSTCLEKARANGITRVELEVRVDNESAIRLYESVGFESEALKRRGLCFDGVYYDSVQMTLFLDVA